MKNYISINELNVSLDFGDGPIAVGRLADHVSGVYFEYDRSFLRKKLPISPLRLPLQPGVSVFEHSLFEGLPGVFNDSLPDGWGRLLFDRLLTKRFIITSDVSAMDRLAYTGKYGMGALMYEPDYGTIDHEKVLNLDHLATSAADILAGAADDVLNDLLALNGSSAGARPKALIGVDAGKRNIIHGAYDLPVTHEPWLVKFANTQDGADAGAVEYVYALMAKAAGIHMPDTHLFPAVKSAGYFAVKRFDREGARRLHMHTAGGLLHSDYRTPALDYEDLIALTATLTRDVREVEKMVQLAIFNVLAHNRDDHAKNFSFLMDASGTWRLSPAYDLTFSSGPGGEQSTSVMDEGRNPGIDHLLKLGADAKLPAPRVQEMIERTRAALAEWPRLAKTHDVSTATTALIDSRINRT